MFETTRHQYLSAMGIDSYMPRCLLPNAPVPQECEWPVSVIGAGVEPVAAGAPEQASPMPQLQQAPRMAAASDPATQMAPANPTAIDAPSDRRAAAVGAAELLADFEPEKAAKKSRPAPADKASLDEETNAEPVEALNFSLSVWRFDDLLVVDSRHSEKALPTEKLLLSMLQAYGLKLGNLSKAQVLQWPMFDMPQADTGAEAAREMLGAFLETLLERPVASWWLMGEDAFHLLPAGIVPEQNNGFGHLIKTEQLASASVSPAEQLITMPSLAEMLERPRLKASAWRAMRQTLARHTE
ncbi:hypothetical protein [Pseudoteredinibacter isoporae]|uniref:Uncharacterized protein n=1 Tax=Pseudoteredinibacter isoporae TaxID=570281 RepID=A0A7X0JVA5_9GAMM|nr:hypothetical protein [Pseudoteredinibacter isoporae]MBB6522927.1 hypothetical protein [Pseudoteredinibacter isoporae]NHO88453.1 hypothetical protein [Pseudoteredinibacter isoporae]NIB23216.1 hypothetical protein [Pseudoteredinibacter isoporae]